MKKKAPPSLPPSHLEAIAQAGFEVLAYQHEAIRVLAGDGVEQREWLPRHLINWATRDFVEYRPAGVGNYAFPGWEPQRGHLCGGRYKTVAGALGWFTWLDAQTSKAAT